MKSLTENYADVYEASSAINQQRDGNEVVFFANLIKGKKKVLDIGCAEGKLSVELAKRGHTVYAADISKTFLRKMSELARKSGVRVTELKMDVENPEGGHPGGFDVIYLMDVLEHLRNPSKALCEIRSMLKNDGFLIINTPNSASFRKFYRYMRWRRRRMDFTRVENCWSLHLQEYDYMILEQCLNFCGFMIEEIVPRSFWSRHFPMLGDNLLVKCRKISPVNLDKQIEHWKVKSVLL